MKGKAMLQELSESLTKGKNFICFITNLKLDIIENSIKNNKLLQSDRKDYIESIEELHKEKQILEQEIERQKQEVLRSNLKQENSLRLHEKVKTDLEYFNEFVRKVKALVYNTEVSEVSNVTVGTLDVIYSALADSFNHFKRMPENKDSSEVFSDNLKLKELLNDYTDKYEKVIDKKNQFITSLQAQLESEKKKKLSEMNVLQDPEYLRLKELKDSDQQSYEGEIRELKKTIAENEAQREKDTTFLNRLKTDNTKLFKQNKTLNTITEENKQLTTVLEETKKQNSDLKEQLVKTQVDLDATNKNLLEARQPQVTNVEEANFKEKYEEIINQLESNLNEQKLRNQELTDKLSKLEAAPQEKSSNAQKNLLKAFNLIKKSKRILELAESRSAPPTEVAKPPPTIIKRKRQTKEDEKQEEVEKDVEAKRQKTDE